MSAPADDLWRLGACALAIWTAACGYDRSDRWIDAAPVAASASCEPGTERCWRGVQRCETGSDGPRWVTIDDCAARHMVCAPESLSCVACRAGELSCSGLDVMRCDASGSFDTLVKRCSGPGVACREGACVNVCAQASHERSNVGCEYWAVDLDNARIDDSLNAAAQQYAVVVSNPQPDVAVRVSIEHDDSAPGEPGAPALVAQATLPPRGLRVFRLGPREVDGSPPGEFDAGTHTALTRAAYRITSDYPIIAYQFNPLENVEVFSNDASLLKPVEALHGVPGAGPPDYVVLGWPQTIAKTDDPNTNFDPRYPSNLRAFLAIVGTREGTRVRLTTTARVLGAGRRGGSQQLLGLPAVPELLPGEEMEVTLNPFDVLNLETDGFLEDFTGSTIRADGPVAVFSGSEASDAPHFTRISARQCCADHLEEQLDPVRTSGKHFIATVSASRTSAVQAAGASLGVVDQPEYFRVIATTSAGARVTTSLAGDDGFIELGGLGDFAELVATQNFLLTSDAPVSLASVSASQEAAGIPRGSPGGDPSFLIIPPVEQFRRAYVFLTPDKYAFDYVRIIAPLGSSVVLDDRAVSDDPDCSRAPAAPREASLALGQEFSVYTCQFGFPTIDPRSSPPALGAGEQRDGVHTLIADRPVGVIVDGFDAFVSYAYAGGTDLRELVIE